VNKIVLATVSVALIAAAAPSYTRYFPEFEREMPRYLSQL
jgi:hypothetical protein